MRRGLAVSLTGHTGHSEETHSPDEWASTVVKRTSPAAVSIAVVCIVAISCFPRLTRTVSSPAESGAYRKARSPPLPPGRGIVPESDFSGLTSSACALAKAPASAPMDSLEQYMAGFHAEDVKANGAGFRALGPDAMANRLFGILGH